MRAVFDTNVLISTLVFGGRLRWLRDAWTEQAAVPVACAETLGELGRVLAYRKVGVDAERRVSIAGQFRSVAEVVVLPAPWPALPVRCRDLKDEVFLALALFAGVPLVSGDADLLVLRGQVAVPILTLAEVRAQLDG